MLPAYTVIDVTRSSTGSVPKAIEEVFIRHVPSGGVSTLQFKAYDQGRRLFQGTGQDGVWLDEEPPDEIHGECAIRLMTTGGLLIETLTPLQGMTPFIQHQLETSESPDGQGGYIPAMRAVGTDPQSTRGGGVARPEPLHWRRRHWR